MTKKYVSIAAALIVLVCASSPAAGQESRSATAAKEFTALLHERNLEAAAARDPVQPEQFVAALYFPRSQLLVISSVHPVPALIEQRLAEQQYRDAYTDLHGSGVREGRIFVTDLGADGLRRTREEGQPFDIVYRNAVDQISYDGDWKAQKLTERDYGARFKKDDAEYTRMLTALTAALRGPAAEQ